MIVFKKYCAYIVNFFNGLYIYSLFVHYEYSFVVLLLIPMLVKIINCQICIGRRRNKVKNLICALQLIIIQIKHNKALNQ